MTILEYLYSKAETKMNFGLSRTQEVLLHCPEKNHQSVIVAGTNAKGSVCNYVTHILLAHKKKVGTFTSPHLHNVFERICIDANPISENDFERFGLTIKKIESEHLKEPLSFFEFLSALAHLYFCLNNIDVAVYEVGLGGRLDSTNAIKHTSSILCNIGYDHMDVLGETLEKIAHEKACVLVPNSFCVIPSYEQDVVLKTIEKIAKQRKVHLLKKDLDFFVKEHDHSFSYQMKDVLIDNLQLPNLGKHQISNASLAVTWALRSLPNITVNQIKSGLINSKMKGRIEFWKKNDQSVCVDVGHNPQAIQNVLMATEHVSFDSCLFGMLRRKDYIECHHLLHQRIENIHLTRIDHPGSIEASDLVCNHFYNNPKQAMEALMQTHRSLLVIGSFYLVGHVRTWLIEQGFSNLNLGA